MTASDDQVVDATMARALHADACREHALVAWVVMWDDPAYPDRFIARLVTTVPLPYVLMGGNRCGGSTWRRGVVL